MGGIQSNHCRATAAAARLSQAEESSGRVEAENQKLREALDQAESRLADAERARVDAETAVRRYSREAFEEWKLPTRRDRPLFKRVALLQRQQGQR